MRQASVTRGSALFTMGKVNKGEYQQLDKKLGTFTFPVKLGFVAEFVVSHYSAISSQSCFLLGGGGCL